MIKFITIAAALLTSGAALAETHSYTEVQGWSIYRNDDNCSAITTFQNSEIVGFFYDAAEKDTGILFTYRNGTSLKEGEKRNLDVLLELPGGRIDDGWTNVEFSVIVGEDGGRTLISQDLQPPALRDFSLAVGIGFIYNGKRIDAYSLQGTAQALAEVKRCAQRVAGINPKDVFAQ